MIKSMYIHIPFCNEICSYCDFCKIYYNKDIVHKYIDKLIEEIKIKYKNEIMSTIYIGGGTPSSLTQDELEYLFKNIDFIKKNKNVEYTIECNIESITEEKIKLFKKVGINRISIGVQTFNKKFSKFLNRKISYEDTIEKIKLCRSIGVNNINIDLMYGYNGQTLEELKDDIDKFIKLDVPHISTYSLILEEHTKLYIDKYKEIDEDLEYEMYEYICKTLKDYNHYEISNFSKTNYESKHNLTYWFNEEYYGFGLGASGYIKDIRYTNTRSINKYLKNEFIYEKHILNESEQMSNEMILGLRKLRGVNIIDFEKKYNQKIEEVFDIKKMLEDEKLLIKNNYIYINEKNLYTSNNILINFLKE